MFEIVQVDSIPQRREQAIAFIVNLNGSPAHQIGYVGEEPAGIHAELTDLNPEFASAFFVAIEGDQLVGALTLDADGEVGRTWVYGPWATGSAADEVADALWNALLPVIPSDAREAELFCHIDNLLVQSFAERHAFTPYKQVVILSIARSEVRLLEAPDVRPLAEADHAAFTRLHDLTFPRTFNTGPQVIERTRESETCRVLTVSDAAGLLGYILVEAFPDRAECNIELVAVDERARGRGIGKQLVSVALRWAFSYPEISEVFLNTEPENLPALGLYEGLGFVRRQTMAAFRKQL